MKRSLPGGGAEAGPGPARLRTGRPMRAPSCAAPRRRCRPRRDGGARLPPAAPPRPAAVGYYDNFTQCTEREANDASCFWPNPLAEGFITGIHKQFFSNCTSEKVHWEDPPDEILITLILIPVMLTCAMITLVVWCSKRSDILV
ncbi:receptor activity-modifying protein 3 isoform X2 [Chroicocephalus ridibundus]|uniref:receptor activity-modifying protein 3 isoform X2 n=1 Tax=Chroicocephalus ridibundus TaxID=1192867 RepID=UPI002FDE4610